MIDNIESPIISELAALLIQRGRATPEEIRGCSQAEIEEVERMYDVKLPAMYRSFLSVMGKKAGDLLRGTHAFYPAITYLREEAELLLKENNAPFSLPEDAFVFLMHQGYQFMYFHTKDAGDDPPIYYFLEGREGITQLEPSFSKLLREYVEKGS